MAIDGVVKVGVFFILVQPLIGRDIIIVMINKLLLFILILEVCSLAVTQAEIYKVVPYGKSCHLL